MLIVVELEPAAAMTVAEESDEDDLQEITAKAYGYIQEIDGPNL